jgi:hypothetical protein
LEPIVDRLRLLGGGFLGTALGIHGGGESGQDGHAVRDVDLDLAAVGQAGLAQASLDALSQASIIRSRRGDENERGGQDEPAGTMGVTARAPAAGHRSLH